ncbi:(2Fe-2S)-binding protein [Streptomyces yaizuensis]|uniref:(2Fe-2S)-binding protein n=1 Tax=Streptomyces yaizuensis TaxID=2989713 RepID=A0ABQ5P5M5_9ACTN|nr:(2Fe-2S)-binding protein [Streptomyces sp. YSPA8]GLF97894.1 (2Fe-2S)-binding protein [Streptomyces sp. YSPA8]
MTLPALLPAPVSPASPASPVTGAYARLTEVFPHLTVRETAPGEPLPSGDGWVRADELAAGGPALDAFLDWDRAQVRRDYGEGARPDVIAGFGLHRFAWPACLLITVPWFLSHRVPAILPEDVSFQRALGRMTVRVTGFACLPGDPAAALPGARVVDGEEALRAEVRAAVAALAGPLLDGFATRMRRGKRALWGMATDDFVEGLWYIGSLLGEEDRAVAELERLLPGALRPFVGLPGFRKLTGPQGEQLPTRDRASCCLFYTLRPEDTCVTCPRTPDADRVARLLPGA